MTAARSRRTIADMMATALPVKVTEVTQTDSYRLIVFNRAGTRVLLESSRSGYGLPQVDIPKFTRPAKEITTLLRDRWQIPCVFLFSGIIEQDPEPNYSAVVEAQVLACPLPERMDWFPVHHAISHLLESNCRITLESSYLKFTNRVIVRDPEPFSRLGWFTHLQSWVRDAIAPLGMELRDFQQFNGSETFSLIRFETTQAPVWFKAVGKPNLHEFPITLALAQSFPEYLPPVIAAEPTCHGWLMADTGGLSLDGLEDSSAWQKAASTLAALQLQSIGRSRDLLQAGCRDLRITKLLGLVDPYLDVMAELMRQQTKVPPPILSREELSELSMSLKNALHSLAALEIPDTLGHSDFNPGNILVGSGRCTFIDWAEAHIGHPFLTFDYLISHLRKDYPELRPFEADITSCYANPWQSVLTLEQISEAFLVTPLVAVFAYSVAGGAWRDDERLKIPQVPGYLRGLTRWMKQEADLLQRRRVECID